MHESTRYRDNRAECLLAAQKASRPFYRGLHLDMANTWLSLARQDEAGENLLASLRDAAEPAKVDERAA